MRYSLNFQKRIYSVFGPFSLFIATLIHTFPYPIIPFQESLLSTLYPSHPCSFPPVQTVENLPSSQLETINRQPDILCIWATVNCLNLVLKLLCFIFLRRLRHQSTWTTQPSSRGQIGRWLVNGTWGETILPEPYYRKPTAACETPFSYHNGSKKSKLNIKVLWFQINFIFFQIIVIQ